VNAKVNIVAIVDVIGALSDETLGNGNLSLADDGAFDSAGQGTTDLATVVAPGQVVSWSVVAVDVQTPVDIAGITFVGGDGASAAAPVGQAGGDANPDTDVWEGVFPAGLTPGVPYKYRLELKMHEGPNSLLSIDSPALISV
jgi:hypothetical protein